MILYIKQSDSAQGFTMSFVKYKKKKESIELKDLYESCPVLVGCKMVKTLRIDEKMCMIKKIKDEMKHF